MAFLSPLFRLRGVHPFSTAGQGSTASTSGSSAAAGAWIATDGSNSTGQGTFDSPWQTFAFALTQQALWEADTLWVKPGTYSTYVGGALASGSTGAVVKVRGQFSTNRPIMQHPGGSTQNNVIRILSRNHIEIHDLVFDATNTDHGCHVESASTATRDCFDIRFYNCEFKNANNDPFSQGAQVNQAAHHIQFHDCLFRDNGSTASNTAHGMYNAGASSCLYSSCVFSSNGAWGFHAHHTSTSVFSPNRGTQVKNCIAHHNGRVGMMINRSSGGSVPSRFENCVAHHNGFTGFLAGTSSGMQFYHCSAAFNTGIGIEFDTDGSMRQAERRNCISFGNGTNIQGSTANCPGLSTSGNLENGSNPSWVSTSNFHLSASTSLARNIGTNLGVDLDIEGNPRFGDPDAGAYEFQA